MKKGFTLIEILVTSSIIMIMLSVTIAYTRRSENINKINRAAERISFDIRRVANLSMQTRQIGDRKICAWGIFFDQEIPNQYVVFSDFCDANLNGDNKYQESEKYEIVKLPINVLIKSSNIDTLVYLPPEPRIYMFEGDYILNKDAEIVLGEQNGSYQKIININQAGNININTKHDK